MDLLMEAYQHQDKEILAEEDIDLQALLQLEELAQAVEVELEQLEQMVQLDMVEVELIHILRGQ
jgi:hypothetical protein